MQQSVNAQLVGQQVMVWQLERDRVLRFTRTILLHYACSIAYVHLPLDTCTRERMQTCSASTAPSGAESCECMMHMTMSQRHGLFFRGSIWKDMFFL